MPERVGIGGGTVSAVTWVLKPAANTVNGISVDFAHHTHDPAAEGSRVTITTEHPWRWACLARRRSAITPLPESNTPVAHRPRDSRFMHQPRCHVPPFGGWRPRHRDDPCPVVRSSLDSVWFVVEPVSLLRAIGEEVPTSTCGGCQTPARFRSVRMVSVLCLLVWSSLSGLAAFEAPVEEHCVEYWGGVGRHNEEGMLP